MRRKILWGAILLIPSLLLPLVPASANLNPENGPSLTGPLDAGKPKCYTKLERDEGTDPDPRNGTNKDQTVMARVQLCSWLIQYDADQETDAVRNYGIGWVQTNIDGRNGYCTKRANTKITVDPADAKVYDRTPKRSVVLSSPRRKDVHLWSNASGHGEVGTVAQHFQLFPNKWLVESKLTDKGRKYMNLWKGKATPDLDLSFAAGVKLSWVESEGTPGFLPRLSYGFIKPNEATPAVCG
ncbi:MAG: hypothetical protein QOH90_506 [Actinomycetota bacterium]|nr:hypothetical protein [Actinomycetota bacterium]